MATSNRSFRKRPRKREVVAHSGNPASSWNDNDVSQITIPADNR
jgi:hypothetical protein